MRIVDVHVHTAPHDVSAADIVKAMDDPTTIPRMCDAKEAWDGRRCERFCEVNEACAKMAAHQGLTRPCDIKSEYND